MHEDEKLTQETLSRIRASEYGWEIPEDPPEPRGCGFIVVCAVIGGVGMIALAVWIGSLITG